MLKAEEEQFAKTLEQGLKILEQDLAELKGNVVPGDVVFKLYDTYGFPMDLTGDIARERNLTLDEEGFEREMDAQRVRARSASSFGMDYNSLVKVDVATEFTGYAGTTGSAKIVAIYKDGQSVDILSEGQEGVIVLDKTPFYAESGGQIGDSGYLQAGSSRFDVRDTTKTGGAFLHHGVLASGSLMIAAPVAAHVDADVRHATSLNHSATHLLHAALRQVLGEHVQQKGSLVDSQRLRFDFSHFEAIKPEQLKALEEIVNAEIRKNSPVETEETDIETAKRKGAMALFGEKYGDSVRVLSMGDFSVELCGGIHANRTGDIGLMKIISEGGVASGVRRIEAVTGAAALAYLNAAEEQSQGSGNPDQGQPRQPDRQAVGCAGAQPPAGEAARAVAGQGRQRRGRRSLGPGRGRQGRESAGRASGRPGWQGAAGAGRSTEKQTRPRSDPARQCP